MDTVALKPESVSVKEALFGNQAFDLVLVQTYGLLLQEDCTKHFSTLLDFCAKSESYPTVSRIMVGAVVAAPHLGSGRWLELTRIFFTHPAFTDEVTPAFVLGAALGLFGAAVWLDTNWKAETDFEKGFPEAIASIVFASGKTIDALGGEKTLHMVEFNPAFESKLSQAIKAWVRGPKPEEYYHGARLGNVWRIIDTVYERFQGGACSNLLGKLIIEQISYGVFGELSAKGKIHALRTFMEDFRSSSGKEA